MRSAFATVVFLLCFVACASGTKAAGTVPESTATPGISAVAITLDELRAKYMAAIGKSSAPAIAQWTQTSGKDAGTVRMVTAGPDFRVSETFAGITTESGDDAGQNWLQTENGITVLINYQHPKYAFDGNVLGEASEPGSTIELLGERPKPTPSYAVRVKTAGGRIVRAYFDETTFLPNHVDVFRAGTYKQYDFDDYRTTDGVTRAWHVHSPEPLPDGTDYRLISLDTKTKLANSDLAIPAQKRILDEFAPGTPVGTQIAARFVDGDIVVRANVGNRGLDFLLDSGTGAVILDDDVAHELGLKAVNKTVRIPQLSIGPIAMHDIAMETLDFSRDRGHHTKVVGLLGFDFLAHAIVRVDYANEKVYVTNPDDFHPDPAWIAVPIALDQRVPVADARIGKSVGHFIVDTGNTAGTGVQVFSHFVKTHKDDVKDQGRGDALRLNNHLSYGRTVSGLMVSIPLEVNSFTFANLELNDYLTTVPVLNAQRFQGEDFDGLIGYGILRLYDLVFDYRDGTVFLVPNKTFRDLAKPSTN